MAQASCVRGEGSGRAQSGLRYGCCRDSRHGGSDGGAGQPRARRRRQWELQGTLGRGGGGGVECGVACWPTPPLFK